jgi:hypothetical protein
MQQFNFFINKSYDFLILDTLSDKYYAIIINYK